MMRACHLNTCPVGIATQDPVLRERFKGTPEQVVNFFFFVAEEVREILASLGLRSLAEAIGRVDLLQAAEAIDHWKGRGVDLTHLLTHVQLPEGSARRRVEPPPEVLRDALDWQLVESSRELLDDSSSGGDHGSGDGDRAGDEHRPGDDHRFADDQPVGLARNGPLPTGDGLGDGRLEGAIDQAQPDGLEGAADVPLERLAPGDGRVSLGDGAATPRSVRLEMEIRNRNRCVGGILSSHIARRHGAQGLPEGSIVVDFEGSAGQSFGGWLAPGVTFSLRGDAQDYVGKGLSGGVLAVRPREGMGEHFKAAQNVIIGNTVLYGATSGRAFFRGLAGERFAVRNSGAWAVVEGVGDHGCEYMTGGRVVVLGPTGRNFAAGMSGGVAYVLDEERTFAKRCNMGMVGFEALSPEDAVELRAMVEEHLRRTGSAVATRVLADWDGLLARESFVKVMPHDYKRVLAERAEAELAVPA
jgi:glutamate synthase domain-containing protein 3